MRYRNTSNKSILNYYCFLDKFSHNCLSNGTFFIEYMTEWCLYTTVIYSVFHMSIPPPAHHIFVAENHGIHFWVPSMPLHNFWLILIGMKKKIWINFWILFIQRPITEILLKKYWELVDLKKLHFLNPPNPKFENSKISFFFFHPH